MTIKRQQNELYDKFVKSKRTKKDLENFRKKSKVLCDKTPDIEGRKKQSTANYSYKNRLIK